jgi:DNA-directed RNA polymerase delta subunit
MEAKNIPIDVENIKFFVDQSMNAKIISEVLNNNEEFFCLTKKVWFLKFKINNIVEESVKQLMLKGKTNKLGYVYFKDIYDEVRGKLHRNNISMDRLSELMKQNSNLLRGKNSRWWILDGFNVLESKKDNCKVFKVVKKRDMDFEILLKNEFSQESESVLKRLIEEYFNNVQIPVSEGELLEDLKCIIDYEVVKNSDKWLHISELIHDILRNSEEYIKTDSEKWILKSFMMYEEYYHNFIAQLERCLNEYDERHKFIFNARNGIEMKKITYQMIGDELNISKQRVTQIYEKIVNSLKRHDIVFRGYSNILYEIVKVSNGIIKREDFYEKIRINNAFLGIDPESVVYMFETTIFDWDVFYNQELNLFFIINDDINNLFEITNFIIDSNRIEDKTSIIDINDIIRTNENINLDTLKYFIGCFPYYNNLKDNIFYVKLSEKLTKFDYIYMILYKFGEPMHFDKISKIINSQFGKEYEPRDIQSTLISSSKIFVRSAAGTYGLRSWGIKEDVYVKDVCYDILKRNGKPMYYGNIAEEVIQIKNVKPKTTYQSLVLDDRIIGLGDGKYALKEWVNN